MTSISCSSSTCWLQLLCPDTSQEAQPILPGGCYPPSLTRGCEHRGRETLPGRSQQPPADGVGAPARLWSGPPTRLVPPPGWSPTRLVPPPLSLLFGPLLPRASGPGPGRLLPLSFFQGVLSWGLRGPWFPLRYASSQRHPSPRCRHGRGPRPCPPCGAFRPALVTQSC